MRSVYFNYLRLLPAFFLVGVLTACVTTHDPLIGKAEATLKGCEFGPPNELLADLKKAEAYLTANEAALKELQAANFFKMSEDDAIKSMKAEFGGDEKRAQATYAYYTNLPVNQGKLALHLNDISQRLKVMEQVRKKSDYAAKVKTQGKLNEEAKQAQLANTAYLENQYAANANFYNGLQGYDYVQTRNRYGSTTTETTFKGKVREQTLQREKLLEAQIKQARQNNETAKQEALNAQESFGKNSGNFSEVKNYISSQSDFITSKAWPDLKSTLSQIETLLAAADPSNKGR